MRKQILTLTIIAFVFCGANFFTERSLSQNSSFKMGQILIALAQINKLTNRNEKRRNIDRLIQDISERKVDFALTAETEKLLRDEGATDEIINAIRKTQESPSNPTKPTEPPLPIPTSTKPPQGKEIQNSIGMEFVLIPKGRYMRGSTKEEDEKPVHSVNINYEFYMGKFEVTISEWVRVMGEIPEGMKDAPRDNIISKFKESERQPVVRISWHDAKEFIARLNSINDGFVYSLPSEAQWEYAARAKTTTDFAFGNELTLSQANFGDKNLGNPLEKTAKVGSYRPNAWGLYDMHGNVSEWTEDIYVSRYSIPRLPKDGTPNSIVEKDSSEGRAVRDCSWGSMDMTDCRSSRRYKEEPGNRYIGIGFRIVAMPRR